MGLGPAVLLSAGALLALPAAGVTMAAAPAQAGVVRVASGPAAVSGGFNGDGRTGLALSAASIRLVQCCPLSTSRTKAHCVIC